MEIMEELMSVVLQLQFRIKLSNNQLNNQLNSKLFNPKLNKLNHKLNLSKMETMELLEEQSKFLNWTNWPSEIYKFFGVQTWAA